METSKKIAIFSYPLLLTLMLLAWLALEPFAFAAPGVQPAAKTVFYFAEGYTGPGFQEYLSIGNPGDTEAKATITYMFLEGGTATQEITILPNSRTTVDVNGYVGQGKQLSAMVESDKKIIAERPMYFNYEGKWTGGHDAVGATSLSYILYFAEGYTGPGFEEWICVLNPGDSVAKLNFYFQTQEEGQKVIRGLTVDPHSRGSFKANDLLGGKAYQTSLTLTSDQPIAAERPMYFNYTGTANRNWTGGHCVTGTPTLSQEYFFAEGTTRSGFEEWLTLQNPTPLPLTVDAVYQLGPGQGEPVKRSYVVPALGRGTVYVPSPTEGVGEGKDVSVYLSAAVPFLAERPCYFSYSYEGLSADGGHCVIGAKMPMEDWFFAEGYTGEGFQQWLCIQNHGDTDATCEITYYTQEAGALPTRMEVVGAGTRRTLMVNEHAAGSYSLSTRVRVVSGPLLVAERPMYFVFRGWDGGHDVVGYAP